MRNGNSKTGSICTKICSVEFLKDLLCCVFGACAMFVSSIIKIPFVYVPFTLQTLAVVLLSVFFGKKHTIGSLLLFNVVCPPSLIMTIGYRIGFFAVPFIVHKDIVERGTLVSTVVILLSLFVVTFIGMWCLACFIGIRSAFIDGFLFFIPAEILKTVIAVAVIKLCKANK